MAKECGISASILSRLSKGKHPDVNGLAALAALVGAGSGSLRQE